MAKPTGSPNITSVLHQKRSFPPAREFSRQAHIKTVAEYETLWTEAKEKPEEFWARYAEELHWFKNWKKVLEWNEPYAKWFVGGQTNMSYNCLDRHLATHRKNKAAIVWEGEPGEERVLRYQDLHREVRA